MHYRLTSMLLLELQEFCGVQKLHVHGVRADAEAHEFAIAWPQAESHALLVRDHLDTGGAMRCEKSELDAAWSSGSLDAQKCWYDHRVTD